MLEVIEPATETVLATVPRATAEDVDAAVQPATEPLRVSTPFGGFKQSGYGRELGPHALEHCTDLKTVFVAT